MSKSDAISSEQFFNDITEGYEELQQFLRGDLKLRMTYVETVDSAPADAEGEAQSFDPDAAADSGSEVCEAVAVHELQKELFPNRGKINTASCSVTTKSVRSKVAAAQKQP